MKHLFKLSIVSLLLLGCTQPIANSLLVDQNSNCDPILGCTNSSTNSDPGALDIQPNSSTMSAPIEGSDTIEITGSCKDLGRKNNRILVQVFAGEDESADPYIDNSISESCYSSTNPLRSGLETVFINPKSIVMGIGQNYTLTATGGSPPYTYTLITGLGAVDPSTGVFTAGVAAGTSIVQVADSLGEKSRSLISVLSGVTTPIVTSDNKRCFNVTKGIGLVEDAGLPNEKIYPQCHNGVFGFSIRLGKVILNATVGQPNYKYLVRFKLRTQEGTISDSTWSKVTIDRNLTTPIITSVTNDSTTQKCTIKDSSARFNPGILYSLNRTYTDILVANAGSKDLFLNKDTLVTTPGTSVFEWDDVGLVDGVTYNYTLSSYEAGFGYSLPAPTALSTVVNCTTQRIFIMPTTTPTANACYLGLSNSTSYGGVSTFNPYVTYEWGYNTTNSGWIGVDYKTNSGYTSAACGNTAVCTEGGLTTGTTYYFALRAKNLVTGEIGIWSPTYACRPQ